MMMMEVVVLMPPAADDFNFNSSSIFSSSYASAPSSPRPFENPFNCYYNNSAPTSTSRVSAVHKDSLYFDWEEKPGSSKPVADDGDAEPFDFAFGFSGQLGKQGWWNHPLATADELFEGGRIRTLKPPAPPAHTSVRNDASPAGEGSEEEEERDRGRNIRRVSRSMSPIRGGRDRDIHDFQKSQSSSSAVSPMAKSDGDESKKWRLRDLFLFRNSSEGRATGRGSKDPLRRFTLLPLSSSSSTSPSTLPSSSFLLPFFSKRKTNRGRSAPAPAMHYAGSQATPEEVKKRTLLAYHHNSMFSYLSFNPAARISRPSGSRSSFSRVR